MKSPEIKSFLDTTSEKLFGRKLSVAKELIICVSCGSYNVKKEDFRDNISRKEYDISGLSQKCQDTVFEEPTK